MTWTQRLQQILQIPTEERLEKALEEFAQQAALAADAAIRGLEAIDTDARRFARVSQPD